MEVFWKLAVAGVLSASPMLLAATAAAQTAPAAPAAPRPCLPQPHSLPGAESHTYATPAGRALRLHVMRPEQGKATSQAIMLFFGGGWSNGSINALADQAKAMRDAGLVAVLADYRVFCRDRSTAADSVADARAAYRWLHSRATSYGVRGSDILLSGGSAGGHLAATVAITEPAPSKPRALVLFNPVADLTLAPIRGSVRLPTAAAKAISPTFLPAGAVPPTLIFHGTADAVVPIASVRDWCTSIVRAGGRCELVPFEGAPHGFFNQRTASESRQSYYAATLSQAINFARKQK